MILLTEVAEKLNKILNGETSEENPTDFNFMVATEGFHLDNIENHRTGKNFIPVFIGARGGDYEPIANLEAADFECQVVFYFPVRFKNDFYNLNNFLANTFVGKLINYGENSGNCLTNISVARFEEMQDIDLGTFKDWVSSVYCKEINVMEKYYSMTFTLYLSTIGTDFMFGNEAVIKLSSIGECPPNQRKIVLDDKLEYLRSPAYDGINGKAWKNDSNIVFTETDMPEVGDKDYSGNKTIIETIYYSIISTEEVIFEENDTHSSSEMASQQLLNAYKPEIGSLPTTTGYANSFACYVKDNDFFNEIIQRWFDGNAQTMRFLYQIELRNLKLKREVCLESVNLNIQKGSPITMTFSFVKEL